MSDESGRTVGGRAVSRGSEAGVALAILVWFLAALSLMVAGIVMMARVDIKLTQLHASRARAEAAADGAMQLALTDLLALQREDAERSGLGFSSRYSLGGLDVAVRMLPLSGLIDLNLATEELLQLLFSTVDGMEENEAALIAERMIEWRTVAGNESDSSEDPAGEEEALRRGRFEAIEDLLLVPGIDRAIFDAVSDAVYVSQRGQRGVDWQSAPVRVLRAIGGGMNEQEAAAIAASRAEDEAQGLIAPAELDMGFQESQELSSYRVDAYVTIGEEVYLRRRWVSQLRTGQDGLPWEFFRSHPVRSLDSVASFVEQHPEALHAGQ